MGDKTKREHAEKGLSAGVLAILFLLCVGVCALFFSLGFLVGYNEQAYKATPAAERVTAPPVTPPTVNPRHAGEPQAKPPATAASAASLAAPAPAPVTPAQIATAVTESKPPAEAAKSESREPARQVPPPPSGAQPESATPAAAGGEVGMGFTVQVAASANKEDADKLVKILKSRGYPVFLVAPEYVQANDNLFRVQVGPFTSRSDAEKVRSQLAQEGFKQPFIKP